METLLALVAAATKEERAELAQLLAGAKPAKKATAVKKEKVEERLSPEVLGQKPEMPEEVELDEDFCHARVEVTLPNKEKIDGQTGDFLGRSSGLKFGGFSSKIFLSQQCKNEPKDGHTLCTKCCEKQEAQENPSNKKSKGNPDAWTDWHGIYGGKVPAKDRMIGSDYSNKVYADWGAAPKSGPSSGKKSSAGAEAPASPKKVEAKKEVKVEAKKEVKPKAEVKKEVKPKTEVKKEEKPSNAAAVVPAPSAPAKKKVVADLYFNPAMDCYWDPIDSAGAGSAGVSSPITGFRADLATQCNTSYATMPLDPTTRRKTEWRNTSNSRFAVLGNRGVKGGNTTGTDYTNSKTLLIHGSIKEWDGNIAYNDNHVEYGRTFYPEAVKSLNQAACSGGPADLVINNASQDNIFKNDTGCQSGGKKNVDSMLAIQKKSANTQSNGTTTIDAYDGGDYCSWD